MRPEASPTPTWPTAAGPGSTHHRDDRLVGNRSWLWIPAGVVAATLGVAAIASVGSPGETLAGGGDPTKDQPIDGVNRFAPAQGGEEATTSSAVSTTVTIGSSTTATTSAPSTSADATTTIDATTTSPAEASTTASTAAVVSSSTSPPSTTAPPETTTSSSTTTTTTTTTPPTTTAPTTSTTATETTGSGCHPNYTGACVPIAEDVDCLGGSGNGPAYVQGPVTVVGEDVYGLDHDNDGIGCES